MAERLLSKGAFQTPKRSGFRLPAEWERHEGTWLAWPHDLETWPRDIAEVEQIFVQMIEALHTGEKIHILVNTGAEERYVFSMLREKGIKENIFFHPIETAGVWIRDYGPMILVGKKRERVFLNWRFNAWGGKYEAHQKDKDVPKRLSSYFKLPVFNPDMVLEGGAVDSNGAGVFLTTEQCLLNSNRNPHMTREQIEKYLEDFLGARRVIWLGSGISGDDTDGHVDDVARFVAPGKIVLASEKDRSDSNYAALRENQKRLSETAGPSGSPFELILLPMPAKMTAGGERLPASYANFYIGNHCVLVPTFRDKNDDRALGVLKELFPEKKVIGIFSTPLLKGLGAIHCATREEPAAV